MFYKKKVSSLMKRINFNSWQQYQAIYVHIPFCKQKCLYCDFASYACFGEREVRTYTDALCHEIEVRAEEATDVAFGATIYFGGGTPSVLPTDCLEGIVSTLKSCGFWQKPAEATIEVNPGTADVNKLKRLREAGFDRISFGVQSLQDAELKTIGRIHNAEEALIAIDMARTAGFRRISCDLIYGLPGQSLASLKDTIYKLTKTGIEHMSVYGLIVEEGTPLERLVNSGQMVLPDEDIAADMYELVQRLLAQAGFERYEISNYAKNGQYSRHNTVYWQYHPYVSFGAAACGMEKALRRTAASTVPEYIAAAQSLTSANWRTSELYTSESLTIQQQLEEFMFMGLRRAAGADLAEARTRFGVDVWQRYQKELVPLIDQGFVLYDAAGERLLLTEAGMELGNQIFAIFINE